MAITWELLMRLLDMKRLLIVTVLAFGASIGTVSNAQASCASPPGSGVTTLASQIDAAPIAFVGTVIGTSNTDRVARVKVESIWNGPVIPTFVTVSGTPDRGSAATSVDRTFKVGQRYLFVPFTSSPPFQDNACSPTRAYSSELDALKPAIVQAPGPGSDGLDPTGSSLSFWIWPGLAGLAALFVAAAIFAAVVRQRRRRGGTKERSAFD
jgi:hypothetical protein